MGNPVTYVYMHIGIHIHVDVVLIGFLTFPWQSLFTFPFTDNKATCHQMTSRAVADRHLVGLSFLQSLRSKKDLERTCPMTLTRYVLSTRQLVVTSLGCLVGPGVDSS